MEDFSRVRLKVDAIVNAANIELRGGGGPALLDGLGGANIDAVKTAADFGIDRSRAVKFCNDRDGIALNDQVLGDTITKFRQDHSIDDNRQDKIVEDCCRRDKK